MIRNRNYRAEETQNGIFRLPPSRNSSAAQSKPRRCHPPHPLVNANPSINLSQLHSLPSPDSTKTKNNNLVNWETETIRESKQREKPPPFVVLRWILSEVLDLLIRECFVFSVISQIMTRVTSYAVSLVADWQIRYEFILTAKVNF